MFWNKLQKLLNVDYKDWETEESVTEKGTRLITAKKDNQKAEIMVQDENTVIHYPVDEDES